jgi:hypothetical protein
MASPKIIKSLTPEQTASIPQYVDRWMKYGLNTDPSDRQRAEEGVRMAYHAAGLQPPKYIIWTKGPYSMYFGKPVFDRIAQALSTKESWKLISKEASTIAADQILQRVTHTMIRNNLVDILQDTVNTWDIPELAQEWGVAETVDQQHVQSIVKEYADTLADSIMSVLYASIPGLTTHPPRRTKQHTPTDKSHPLYGFVADIFQQVMEQSGIPKLDIHTKLDMSEHIRQRVGSGNTSHRVWVHQLRYYSGQFNTLDRNLGHRLQTEFSDRARRGGVDINRIASAIQTRVYNSAVNSRFGKEARENALQVDNIVSSQYYDAHYVLDTGEDKLKGFNVLSAYMDMSEESAGTLRQMIQDILNEEVSNIGKIMLEGSKGEIRKERNGLRAGPEASVYRVLDKSLYYTLRESLVDRNMRTTLHTSFPIRAVLYGLGGQYDAPLVPGVIDRDNQIDTKTTPASHAKTLDKIATTIGQQVYDSLRDIHGALLDDILYGKVKETDMDGAYLHADLPQTNKTPDGNPEETDLPPARNTARTLIGILESATNLIYSSTSKRTKAYKAARAEQKSATADLGKLILLDIMLKMNDSLPEQTDTQDRESKEPTNGDIVADLYSMLGADEINTIIREAVLSSAYNRVREEFNYDEWRSVLKEARTNVGAEAYGQNENWLSFYDFLYDNGLQEEIEPLRGLIQIAQSTGWWIPFTNIAVMSERYKEIHQDDQSRLHNMDGPAVAFRDGWSMYTVHGVNVSPSIIEHPELITLEMIDSTANVEVRRVMLEKFGFDRYIRESKSKLLDQSSWGKLWRRDFRDDEPIVMLEVQNSTPEPDGSYKTYFLRVPPNMTIAKEAVAWTFEMNQQSYDPRYQT